MRSEVRAWATATAILAAGIGTTVAARPARADVAHVIARGHTVEAIAHRYRVPVKAILEANHLKDGLHLKVGDTLTIPGVLASPRPAKTAASTAGVGKAKSPAKEAAVKPANYVLRPRTPGVVHAIRLSTSETFSVKIEGPRGRVAPATLKTFERMLRSTDNHTHPVDARLVALVGVVSNHFGSRPVQVVSGFRPYASTQHTSHSNHNIGRAIDFRVVGVPNDVVRDYCRTLKNVGVGYYPNASFVHLDVRETPSFWTDFSKPGETPRYNSPNVDADEATSDVTGDEPASKAPRTPPASNAPPPELPPLEAPGSSAPERAGDLLHSAAMGASELRADPASAASP